MSCSCLDALLAAIKPPWGILPDLKIPPIIAQLQGMGAGMSAAASLSANASAHAELSALLKLGLPALPIPPFKMAQMAGIAATAGQLNSGLGINIFDANASAKISALLSLFINLPPLDLPKIEPLGSLCSTLLMVKASLGVDLLAPGAAIALKASLSAMAKATATATLGLPGGSMSVLASYSMMASLAASAGVGLDFGGLAAKLSLVADLNIAGPGWSPMGLLQYLAALAAALKMFGFNPFTIDASAKLALAFKPLSLLADVHADASAVAAASMAQAAGGINLALSASFAAMATANFSALLALKLPDLAPLSLVAGVAAQARGSSACGSGCPISI